MSQNNAIRLAETNFAMSKNLKVGTLLFKFLGARMDTQISKAKIAAAPFVKKAPSASELICNIGTLAKSVPAAKKINFARN